MKTLLLAVCIGFVTNVSAAVLAPAQPIAEWNEQVLAIAEAEDGFLTLKGLRTVTMMHIAMHDSLAGIRGRYRPYLHAAQAPDASPLAAIAAAAHAVASDQYPDQRKVFDVLRDRQLAVVADPAALAAGTSLGTDAARAILDARGNDGWNTEAKYQWHPMGPGVYAEFHEHSNTPEGFVFGAGWAQAKPFALPNQDRFVLPPPPAIDSDQYTRAYNEVKELGRFQTMHRTPDQTHIALWWKDFAENSHNRLARDLVLKEQLDLQDAARLFALLNIGIYDGYISVFHNKFRFNHWRPYTAIRWAANDGNPNTDPDETWNNTHLHTYAFPSYPSAHGTACAAAMSAFTEVFGDSYAFTMRTPTVDIAGPYSGKISMEPATRSFDSFNAAATECGLSRLYLGIHFRYDSVAGVDLGGRVGRYVQANFLRPLDGD